MSWATIEEALEWLDNWVAENPLDSLREYAEHLSPYRLDACATAEPAAALIHAYHLLTPERRVLCAAAASSVDLKRLIADRLAHRSSRPACCSRVTARQVARSGYGLTVTQGIVLDQGIETCLSTALEGLTPVWATLDARNLANFPVLPGIEGLTILVDHDPPNRQTGKRAGTEAAIALIERYTKAGFDRVHDIRVIFPPTEGEDINDLVRQLRGAA
jgi:hypothetical protein